MGEAAPGQDLAERVGARVVSLHPPFRWQREYVRGFEKGLAAMAEETDVLFAVENMYPLQAGGSEVVPDEPALDPTALDVPSITLDLSHTAASGSDCPDHGDRVGSRLVHVHLADGTGSPAARCPTSTWCPAAAASRAASCSACSRRPVTRARWSSR